MCLNMNDTSTSWYLTYVYASLASSSCPRLQTLTQQIGSHGKVRCRPRGSGFFCSFPRQIHLGDLSCGCSICNHMQWRVACKHAVRYQQYQMGIKWRWIPGWLWFNFLCFTLLFFQRNWCRCCCCLVQGNSGYDFVWDKHRWNCYLLSDVMTIVSF